MSGHFGLALLLLGAALALLPTPASGAERLGCTALAIDGAASINGAAFAVENTDCNMCDFRLNYVAPRNHTAEAVRHVFMNPPNYPRFVGYGRGDMYHPKPGQALSKPIGQIPEVPQTFGYYESINPLMNDHGLGVGESSCAAMLQNRMPNGPEDPDEGPEAIIDAMTMQQLALERCATARCAVELLGDLAERFGYLPFGGEPSKGTVDGKPCWADSGEAFLFADAKGEAWVFNVVGGVKGVVKSVWAAQRVPKGHVAVVANEFTMGEIPEEPNEDFLFAKDIRRAAKAAGLWDGQGLLDFSQVFAPNPVKYSTGNPPIPLYSSLRRWRLLSLAAPSLNLQFEIDHRKYPFSVKAEQSVSRRDVMAMMKDHYAGTEFDMTQGILAGPYRTPFRVEGGPNRLGDVPRGISILRTLYSTITETGPTGSVAWYAADTPATSVYVPLDHRTDAVAETYRVGRHEEFDRTSAWWAFSFVNNWMQLNYEGMSREDVLPRAAAWQDRLDEALLARSSSPSAPPSEPLGAWQLRVQEEVAASWWQLADHLVMKWNDMSRTAGNVTDRSLGYPEWFVRMVGFSQDVHPIWVQPAASPPPQCATCGAPATVALPRAWDRSSHEWVEWGPLSAPACTEGLAAVAGSTQGGFLQALSLAIALVAAPSLLAGFALGRRHRTRDIDGEGGGARSYYLLS